VEFAGRHLPAASPGPYLSRTTSAREAYWLRRATQKRRR